MRYFSSLLLWFRPAFNRAASFYWFAVIVVGFIIRTDFYGVTSVIRALSLPPNAYFSLLHFFRSTSCTFAGLLERWQLWVMNSDVACKVNGRHVVICDHTNNVKDARKMPAVKTIHQNSETASKPSYFRGHKWVCLGLLVQTAAKCLSLPVWAEIHPSDSEDSQAVRPVSKALEIFRRFKMLAYLVVDAFFAVGPVFLKARESGDQMHVVTRAKSNFVGYITPPSLLKKKRGRPKKYGKKIWLQDIFKDESKSFKKTKALIYGRSETIEYLVMDLIWKPVKDVLRFFWVKSSRGNIIIMTSDLMMCVQDACFLYCRRATIETFFDVLKNLLRGTRYHFWSRYLEPVSRRPKKNEKEPVSSKPEKTKETLSAIQKFLAIQVIVVGIIQLLSVKAAGEIVRKADCWQRTSTMPEYPSPFVVIAAMRNMVSGILCGVGENWISRLIHYRQKNRPIPANLMKVA